MRTTKRRDTLRVFGTGLVATLAGCGGSQSIETTGRTVTQPSTQTATPTVTETPNETATQTATSVPRVVWRQTVGNYLKSSPAVVDGTVFVGSHARTVSALDIDDGTEQWTVETDGSVFGGPTVVDRTVYVGTEEGLYAITAVDGSIEWRTTDLWNIRSQPTVRDDTVYVGSDDTHVYALDIETGTVLWQSQSLGGHHSQILCSPAVVDDTVVVGTGDRAVVALDAETGTHVGREDCTSVPLAPSSPFRPTRTVSGGSRQRRSVPRQPWMTALFTPGQRGITKPKRSGELSHSTPRVVSQTGRRHSKRVSARTPQSLQTGSSSAPSGVT